MGELSSQQQVCLDLVAGMYRRLSYDSIQFKNGIAGAQIEGRSPQIILNFENKFLSPRSSILGYLRGFCDGEAPV